MMFSFFIISLTLTSVCVRAEFCHTGLADDCLLEKCPAGYTVKCVDNVCSCESSGECSVSDDCHAKHGKCENNDKHWYCNGGRCCCGEPCPHAGDTFVCSTPDDCAREFFRCTNNDKHWYCTHGHCNCGSRNGGIDN